MGGYRADDVVDFQLLQQPDTDRADDRAHAADNDGPVMLDDVGAGGNRDQPGNRAVQACEQVHAAKDRSRDDEGNDHAGRRRKIRVDQDMAHRHRIGGAAQCQLRPAVKPQPAEPQDEHAECHYEDIGRGCRLDGTVPSEFPQSRADNQDTRERRPATGAVDNGRTGEVLESHCAQPPASPCPGAHNGVDDSRQGQREQKERPHLNPLRQRPRYNRGGRSDKNHLEEPVGHCGVFVRDDLGLCRLLPAHQGDIGGGRAVEECKCADELPDVRVHEVVTQEVIGESGDRVKADVLHADHGGVLGAYRTGLEHREPGAHPHNERTPDQKREGVEDEHRLLADGCIGGGGPAQQTAKHQQDVSCQ